MIKPTVGRVVWYHPSMDFAPDASLRFDPYHPLAAIVAYVFSDRLVNLMILNQDGIPQNRTKVRLVQEGESGPQEGGFCEWMPYQKGQAAKAEALEKELGK